MRLLIIAGLGCVTLPRAHAALCLADGRPLVCVYYFGHWWEPWKSSDEAIRQDLRTLRDMGVSVLAVDHEWSQAIDGNWRWLDREHRLAKEAGLQLLPWLSLKVWSDMSDEGRRKLVKEWYGEDLKLGENQDGTPGCVQIWDEATVRVGAAYAAQYLDRFRKQALLHVNWQGVERPVVALSVELAWAGGGFDAATTAKFIAWARQQYGDSIARLNEAWGTAYRSFEEINPRDTTVFDFARLQAGEARHPRAAEDHIEFRAQVISEVLGRQAALLRQRHPDVLTLAELPYQLASQHPHAQAYRIAFAANPSCARSADILFLRSTGPLTPEEADALSAWRRETGQPVILTYRTYSHWASERSSEEIAALADLYATQAASLGDGFGFYSWNEMGDTHVAASLPPQVDAPAALTPEQSGRSIALLRAMVARYLDLVAQR